MALDMKFVSKKEEGHMMKFELKERLSVYVDPKTGKERLANLDPKTGDKDSVFLLGPVGSEIELARAEALGLVKAKPAKKVEEK